MTWLFLKNTCPDTYPDAGMSPSQNRVRPMTSVCRVGRPRTLMTCWDDIPLFTFFQLDGIRQLEWKPPVAGAASFGTNSDRSRTRGRDSLGRRRSSALIRRSCSASCRAIWLQPLSNAITMSRKKRVALIDLRPPSRLDQHATATKWANCYGIRPQAMSRSSYSRGRRPTRSRRLPGAPRGFPR